MRLRSYLTGWNLDEGRRFAQILQAEIAPRGWHCGIGGSVLHKGASAKDLDVFVIPHSTVRSTLADLELGLVAAGAKAQRVHGFDPGPGRGKGRRVDVIALVPWSMP